MLFDAHNHFHDSRLDGLDRERTLAGLRAAGIGKMVVNGTSPADWPAVQALAAKHPDRIIPSFGVHPWKTEGLPDDWFIGLCRMIDAAAGPVGVGEIGLDRWIDQGDFATQLAVFRRQWQMAVERDLPITVHCLRAWGPLLDELRSMPVPRRGFLVHSPGASPEVINELLALGAYFSISGAFADSRRAKYRRALEAIPLERLLIETDAPDMLPPEAMREAPLWDPVSGEPVTHPAELTEVYGFVATQKDLPREELEHKVGRNFERFFLTSSAEPHRSRE